MVFATAVDDWLTTVAWANVSPGITAMSTSPYASRLPIATALNVDSCITLIVPMCVQTDDRSATCGSTPKNSAPTTTAPRTLRTSEPPTTALLGRQHPFPDNPGTLCAHTTSRLRRTCFGG